MRTRWATCLAPALLAVFSLLAPAKAVPGYVVVTSPNAEGPFEPGNILAVQGRVLAVNGTPLAGAPITARLLDAQGESRAERSGATDPDGRFLIPLEIPLHVDPGGYVVALRSPDPEIAGADVPIRIESPFTLQSQFMGLPVWLWLLLVVSTATASIGATAYSKFAGLGHVAGCAACGAFAPEDSVRCPRCGAEMPQRSPAPRDPSKE